MVHTPSNTRILSSRASLGATAPLQLATSHSRILAQAMMAIISLVLVFITMLAAAALPMTTAYAVQAEDAILEKRDISYDSRIHFGNHFYFSDNMLIDAIGATEASGELALASAGLSEAAYDFDKVSEPLAGYGQMGFTECYKSPYYEELSATYENPDVVAFSIFERYVNYNGQTYRMIVAPVRGTPETAEWYSDFNLGTGNDHQGFYTAASLVLNELRPMLGEFDASRTIVWTMGHSRGAAVANIVAGTLTKEWDGNVVAYTFACPAVSKNADTSLRNIYNHNNAGDLVPAVPLADWGFKRFGQTITLPESDYYNLCRRFKQETDESYTVGMSTFDYEVALKDIAPTQSKFAADDKIRLAVDLVSYFLGGKHDDASDLLDIVASHPSACISIVSGEISTQLFPYSTVAILGGGLTVEELQLKLNEDMQNYQGLGADIQEAISETSTMSDVDGETEAAHRSYEAWLDWRGRNGELLSEIRDKTGIEVNYKDDLEAAYAEVEERYPKYHELTKTILDFLALYYDTDGNLLAPFTQGHNRLTYVLWTNSLYFGYKGWFNNPSVTTVDWAGQSQRGYVGMSCFEGCENITNVTVPEGMMVGEAAFKDCTGLTQLNLPQTGSGASICKDAFVGCGSLTSLTIPDNTATIGDYAFANCPSIVRLSVPYSPNIYGIYWISGSEGIKDLVITPGTTAGVTAEDESALHPCYAEKLERLTIAEGMREVPERMFSDYDGCGPVRELILPASLEKVGWWGLNFKQADQELRVVYGGDVASWCAIDFNEDVANPGTNPLEHDGAVLVIDGQEVTDLVIPEGVEYVGKFAFRNYDRLTSVKLPSSLKSIGVCAFSGCGSIRELSIPFGVSRIEESAFSECTGLTRVSVPTSLQSMGYDAFAECDNITDVFYGGTSAQWEQVEGHSCLDGRPNVKMHFTEEPAPLPESSIAIAPQTKTYTGKPIAYTGEVTRTGSTGRVTYQYYSDARCTREVSAYNVVNAGIYYVKATVAADDKYRAATSAAAKLTVGKARSSIELAPQAKTYTGKALAYSGKVTKAGSTGKVTYQYFSNAKCTKSVKAADVKNSGTYYVKATVAADANHKAATSAAAKFTVGKARSSIKLAAQSKTYTGKPIAYTGKVTRTGSHGKVTYKYYSDAKCTKVIKAANVKKPGTYYVKATVAADANHKAATSNAAKLTVKAKAKTLRSLKSAKSVSGGLTAA